MKIKYDLSAFEKAADVIDAGAEFCCNRIEDFAGKDSPEVRLFKKAFGVTEIHESYVNSTFYSKWYELVRRFPTIEELRETRVLSLCLAHEIARLKNNRKGSGF